VCVDVLIHRLSANMSDMLTWRLRRHLWKQIPVNLFQVNRKNLSTKEKIFFMRTFLFDFF
jgi:hypothetical protein